MVLDMNMFKMQYTYEPELNAQYVDPDGYIYDLLVFREVAVNKSLRSFAEELRTHNYG